MANTKQNSKKNNYRKNGNKNFKNNRQDSKEVKNQAAIHDVCDMMRYKAKSMGRAVAKLPKSVWDDYRNANDKKSTLISAKLYIENYMMGNLNGSEFARVMAEDDNLRYAVSDLCRMKLEPVVPNIERNNSYIDVVAGVKTFWTEIHVPLPSEIAAARDIKNINFGVEAGKAATGAKPVNIKSEETSEKKSRSFREIFDDAKVRAAKFGIEKLTPIAEGGKSAEDDELDELFDEQSYKNECTKNAAQHLENVAMTLEAGKSGELAPDECKKAFMSAGLTMDQAEELAISAFTAGIKGREFEYSDEELNIPLDDQMKELFDQMVQHCNNEAAKEHADEQPLFDESDEELMNYYMNGGTEPEQNDVDIDDYYAHLAEDIAAYENNQYEAEHHESDSANDYSDIFDLPQADSPQMGV